MDKKIKGIRIFLIIYGGAITFLSFYFMTMSLLMITTSNDFSVERVWVVFMPFLFIIGICFLLFGLLIKKIKTKRQLIFLIISTLSIIWYILYAYFVRGTSNYPFMGKTDGISIVLTVLFYITIVASSAVFIVPELIIWKKIKRIERQNIIEEKIINAK
ncbi:MAG TPA: hypothetical protein PKI01_00140 [Bacteroidales bacterium]|nr:hypothetical protein [Bacteroidales bacterium]